MTFRGKFMISKALVTLETLEHQGFYSNTVALEYAPNIVMLPQCKIGFVPVALLH